MYEGGADVIYQAAGGSGARRVRGRQGRERDGHRRRLRPVNRPRPSCSDVIITSMLKQVDVAVFDSIDERERRRVQPAEIVTT